MEDPIVVVGAGLCGLVAARELRRAGRSVLVVDDGGSIGGRLATAHMADSAADTGAQFFTTRGPEFTSFVDELAEDGLVYEWCRGFNEVDGFPRFAVAGGMAALAARLAEGVEVHLGLRAERISRDEDGWLLSWTRTAGGQIDPRSVGAARADTPQADTSAGHLRAAAILLTPPVPESLFILGDLADDLDPGVRSIGYHRVLAVIARLNGPSAIPDPGARQLDDGPFSFVADNRVKGTARDHVVTLHTSHARSAELWGLADPEALTMLLGEAEEWLGGPPTRTVSQARIIRWRYAGPQVPWPDRWVEVDRVANGPVLLAGDAFGGPKVEGAFLSGLHAGRHLAGPVVSGR